MSEADIGALVKRLTRLDKSSSHGPWTRQALELIDRNPAVVSTVLAEKMGLERPVFKIDIRKLKESGLTESLEVGYRLSPRGKRLLAHMRTIGYNQQWLPPPVRQFATCGSNVFTKVGVGVVDCGFGIHSVLLKKRRPARVVGRAP